MKNANKYEEMYYRSFAVALSCLSWADHSKVEAVWSERR